MKRDIIRPAEKRLHDLETEQAKSFDATILHNSVADQLREDDDLRATLDIAERSYQLAERTDADDLDRAAFGAAEQLEDRVDDVVERAVATIIVDVYQDLDEWGDAWAPEDIEAARQEAEQWVADHREVVLEVADEQPIAERTP